MDGLDAGNHHHLSLIIRDPPPLDKLRLSPVFCYGRICVGVMY